MKLCLHETYPVAFEVEHVRPENIVQIVTERLLDAVADVICSFYEIFLHRKQYFVSMYAG